jgi:CII-binding regulator of phage lambda lysogenization HflD
VQTLEQELNQMKEQTVEINRRLELQTSLLESFSKQMEVQQKQAEVSRQQQETMMRTLDSIQNLLAAKEGGGEKAPKQPRLADGNVGC